MHYIGLEYQDVEGLPAYLCQDGNTGRLAVMFDQDVLLPVQRDKLDEFMAWHGLRLAQR